MLRTFGPIYKYFQHSIIGNMKAESRSLLFYIHTHTLDIEKHIQPFNTLTWTMLPVRFLEPCIDCIMQSLSLLLFNILLPLILIAGLQTWFCDTYFVAQEVSPKHVWPLLYIVSNFSPFYRFCFVIHSPRLFVWRPKESKL